MESTYGNSAQRDASRNCISARDVGEVLTIKYQVHTRRNGGRISVIAVKGKTKCRKQIGRMVEAGGPGESQNVGDENAIPDTIITRALIHSRRSLPYKYFLGVDVSAISCVQGSWWKVRIDYRVSNYPSARVTRRCCLRARISFLNDTKIKFRDRIVKYISRRFYLFFFPYLAKIGISPRRVINNRIIFASACSYITYFYFQERSIL